MVDISLLHLLTISALSFQLYIQVIIIAVRSYGSVNKIYPIAYYSYVYGFFYLTVSLLLCA